MRSNPERHTFEERVIHAVIFVIVIANSPRQKEEIQMIHVIASIYTKEGTLPEMVKIYESFVPKVMAEKGCIMYCPTADFETEIPTQLKEKDIITVIEKWEDLESFNAHLCAPHSCEFRKDIKDIVEKVSIKVLKNIL